MISDQTIESIKQAANVLDVVGEHVKLKRNGSSHIGLCPFHSEKSPSFSVNTAKGIFKCFGCGKSGDAIAFLMEHDKISYLDAIRSLGKRYNIEIEEYAKKDFVRPVARLEKLGKKSLEWFENERKITNDTLLRFGVTEAVEYMPQFKKEVNTVCFNYYRGEDLINIKFRGPQKSFKLAKDAELIFFNLNAIKDEKTCVIVEGEIDCLTMHQCGIYNVISVPNGAAKGNQKLEYLDNCYEYFTNIEKVIIAVDNDNPGKMLMEELGRRLGYHRCFQVVYPEGCKDSNDVLVKFGKEKVSEIVHNAIAWPISGLISLDDIFPEIDDYFENGYPEGLKTHVPDFDNYLTFYPGQLTVITGIPGSGKSEYVDLLMTSLSKFHGINWGVCSFETPAAIHVTKLMEKITGKSFAQRHNPDHRMTRSQFEGAMLFIDKHFHFINSNLIDITMDGLLQKAEELVLRKGITGLLFDPWNCIEAKYSEGESETKYVLTCLNKLINFLDKYKVHGFLVAHPTKLQKNKQTGKYNVATMYDISGSAHFFNRTHNGLSIYRDFETGTVDVYVQKVKWSWLGKLGFCSFHFNTATRQYEVLRPDDNQSILPGFTQVSAIPFEEF